MPEEGQEKAAIRVAVECAPEEAIVEVQADGVLPVDPYPFMSSESAQASCFLWQCQAQGVAHFFSPAIVLPA